MRLQSQIRFCFARAIGQTWVLLALFIGGLGPALASQTHDFSRGLGTSLGPGPFGVELLIRDEAGACHAPGKDYSQTLSQALAQHKLQGSETQVAGVPTIQFKATVVSSQWKPGHEADSTAIVGVHVELELMDWSRAERTGSLVKQVYFSRDAIYAGPSSGCVTFVQDFATKTAAELAESLLKRKPQLPTTRLPARKNAAQ